MRRLLEELYGGRARALDVYVRAEQSPDPESRVRLSERARRLRDAARGPGMAHRRAYSSQHTTRFGAPGCSGRARGHRPHFQLCAYRRAAFRRALAADRRQASITWGRRAWRIRRRGGSSIAIAGCSGSRISTSREARVFPTSGLANPTLTLVALALRLADRISRGFCNETRLETLVAGGMRAAGGVGLREVWRGNRPQVLRFFVERDYDAERVVNLGGWLISATEASLLAHRVSAGWRTVCVTEA